MRRSAAAARDGPRARRARRGRPWRSGAGRPRRSAMPRRRRRGSPASSGSARARSRCSARAGPRASAARWRARAVDRAVRRRAAASAGAAASSAAPPTQSSGTAASAAWVGVEQQTAATSSIRVESRSCPTALITGTRSIATVRQRVSSQKAQRSARLPPPRETTIASTSGRAARSCSAARDRRRRVAVLDRREGPDDASRASRAARSPASRSRRAAPRLRRDDADRLRQQRPRQLLLQLEEALGAQLRAQRLQPRQQVPFAGQPHVGGAEAEARARPGAPPG